MKYDYKDQNKLSSLEVTLAMGCRLDCTYCPQQKLLGEYFKQDKARSARMSLEDFKRIVQNVKTGGTICFSGMCEAFLNPDCADMILYAHEKGYRITLLTTLTGIEKEHIDKLKYVDFDGITLHIPDKEGNSKFIIDDTYMEVLQLFHKFFKVTAYSCHGHIHPDVAACLDRETAFGNVMIDRAGNLDYGLQHAPKGEIVCMVGTIGSYGNWTPEVLPDGTLLLCCMDYGMKHVLGNLLEESAEEILGGTEYRKVMLGMKDDSMDILCRKCSGAMETGCMPAYRFQAGKRSFREKQCQDLKPDQQRILDAFDRAEEICIFGMGKLFWDNFYNQKWNEVIGQKYFCDNSSELWGHSFKEIPCISPRELGQLSEPLVITHMKDDTAVRKQLQEMGIGNIINIFEIYNAF